MHPDRMTLQQKMEFFTLKPSLATTTRPVSTLELIIGEVHRCVKNEAWFAAAMIYYGVVLLTSQMEYSGNKYVGMVVVSISEIPAYTLTYLCAIRKREW